ncbi:hypothetical protein RCH23_002114 [Cryobacterium sp. CAN_C3]|uniref:hypothetical protein n=1 Tax=unclassified Cryobacterium TaxID=2649013 RepID=UPI0018C93629|nr:hypothetical protein [Cryobacterium sp. CAN_C3]MEC5154729.1 hypothetical protein [Cryobacterium sp. CAN_C3]
METSRTQAQAALDWLRTELTADFPLASDEDEARLLTYFVTASARALVDSSPFILFTGDRSTGKSTAAAIGRAIAGDPARYARISGRGPDERTDSLILAAASTRGLRFVHCEDVPAHFDSPVVEDAVDAQDGDRLVRVSGSDGLVPIAGLTLTGESVGGEPSANLARHSLVVHFATPSLQPRRPVRAFRHPNIVDWVVQNRVVIVQRIATILQHGFECAQEIPGAFKPRNYTSTVLGGLSHVTIDGELVSDLAVSRDITEGPESW